MHLKSPKRIAAERLVTTLVLGSYFANCAISPGSWHFLDGVDLVIHEAGHTLFSFDGFFLTIAGGSLLQVLVPAGVALYFFLTRQPWSGAIVLMWMGQSLLNVAVYAADAETMDLPLVGGEDVLHDWNYMLASTGHLPLTELIAGALRWLGTLIIAGGLLLAGWLSFTRPPATPTAPAPLPGN